MTYIIIIIKNNHHNHNDNTNNNNNNNIIYIYKDIYIYPSLITDPWNPMESHGMPWNPMESDLPLWPNPCPKTWP
jgi:hypothetical protein